MSQDSVFSYAYCHFSLPNAKSTVFRSQLLQLEESFVQRKKVASKSTPNQNKMPCLHGCSTKWPLKQIHT